MSELEISAQSLCKACGLCCDGTLFGFACSVPEDDHVLLKSKGFKFSPDQTKYFLPCTAHKNQVCTLYDSTRAQTCSAFKCKLLNQFNKNEISSKAALQIILGTLADAGRIKNALIQVAGQPDACLHDLYFLVKELNIPLHNRLLLDYVVFRRHLDKYFSSNHSIETHPI